MRLLLALRLAVRALVRRPLRTFLLAQGTAWGVAVAILPAAVLEGSRAAARERGPSLGVDRVAVVRDPTAPGGPLEHADVARIASALKGRALEVGGVQVLTPDPATGDAAAPTWIRATPRAAAARGLRLAAGRWWTAADPPEVCVVEAGVAAALGRPALAPGDRITGPDGIGRRVLGVTAARDDLARATDELGFDTRHPLYRGVAQPIMAALGVPESTETWKRSERVVYVPWGTAGDGAPLDWIFVQLTEAGAVREATADLRGLPAFAERPIVCRYALVLPSLLDPRLDRFAAVAWAMFLACLVMGAVVIANLGLVTALGRRGEIALHRVEGATRRDVALETLLEGVLLAAAGGLLGFGLGAGLAELRVRLEPIAGFGWVFPWERALLALLVALVVGCLAAWLPARRVAASDPASALEAE